MLDPKDIRVGNWVLKITGTDGNQKSFFEYKPVAVDEYYYTFASRCFPIPINAALLGKCGFKQEPEGIYQYVSQPGTRDTGSYLRYQSREGKWFLNEKELPNQPLYLHQLQNLVYALYSEELTINMGQFQNTDLIGPINFFSKAAFINRPIHNLL